MFNTIKEVILVLANLRSFIFMLLSSPRQLTIYAKLAYSIKDHYDKKDIVDASFSAIDELLEFRKNHKDDFDDLFNHLEKLSGEYKSNRQLHDSLIKVIEENNNLQK